MALLGALLAGCAIAPVPLDDETRLAEMQADVVTMFDGQEPLRGALTLEQAFARALAYNLDQRVKMMELALANDDLDLAKFDLLPRLVANAGYYSRNNVLASSSQSVATGAQSLEPSTSTDRNLLTADLTASWNILDFGVSYFNARQQANRTLVAEEQRRKVIHSLFQEVRRAYWRAAAAQQLSGRVQSAIRSAESALGSSRRVETEALRAPVDALRYQRSLLDVLRDLEATQRQLTVAKTELASLINLPPGQNYVVAIPRTMRIAPLRVPVRQMEYVALLRNPDLREASYQVRIQVDETRKSILRVFPGVNFSYGPNYDSNSFLVNNHWYAGAIRASGNLMALLTLPRQMQRGEAAENVAEARRQALSMTVLAKVHIAYRQYLSAAREYRWADQMAGVDRRLFQQISNRAETDAQSDLERVSAQLNAVNSDLRRYLSYADAQAALGRLYAAIGVDPVPSEVVSLDLGSLSVVIRKAASDWQHGRPAQTADVAPVRNDDAQAQAQAHDHASEPAEVAADTPAQRPSEAFADTVAQRPDEPARASLNDWQISVE